MFLLKKLSLKSVHFYALFSESKNNIMQDDIVYESYS